MTTIKQQNPTTNQSKYGKNNRKDMSLFQQMYTKLRWTTQPNRIIPHGLCGIVTLVIGYYLFYNSLIGNLYVFGVIRKENLQQEATTTSSTSTTFTPIYIVIFYIAAMSNAIGGYIMAPTAIKIAVPIFRMASIMQLSLIYWSIRFFPSTLYNIIPLDSTAIVNGTMLQSVTTYYVVRFLDIICALGTLNGVVQFLYVAYTFINISVAISIGITFAAFGLSTIFFYPAQIMINPQWLYCTVQNYPLQGVACTAYIYIPVISIFSLLAFMATLYIRKMISDVQMGFSVGIWVVFALITTIGTMEWFLADISTQLLYIPTCDYKTQPGDWDHYVENFLDVSTLTRNVIRSMFGAEVPVSEYTFFQPISLS